METSGRIWPNFELIQALMYFIITCKNEKDPIKNRPKKAATSFSPLYAYGDFFRRSRAANSTVGGPIRPIFGLVRALMHVIVTCKYEKGTHEKQPRKSGNTVFPIITTSVTMETSGWIWPNFKLIQALMYFIITCKYEKDPIKNTREKVETSFLPL